MTNHKSYTGVGPADCVARNVMKFILPVGIALHSVLLAMVMPRHSQHGWTVARDRLQWLQSWWNPSSRDIGSLDDFTSHPMCFRTHPTARCLHNNRQPAHKQVRAKYCKGSNRWTDPNLCSSISTSSTLFPGYPFLSPAHSRRRSKRILDLMIFSPVLRKATLCQSAYFYSLMLNAITAVSATYGVEPGAVIMQTREAFNVLRLSLQVIDSTLIHEDHLHGAVRALTSIVHIQRFEIAASNFDHCKIHLDGATALFQQILDSEPQHIETKRKFNSIISRLGSVAPVRSNLGHHIPSAERSAFCFSTAMLVFDNVIAGTVLQRPLRLHAQALDADCDRVEGLISPVEGLADNNPRIYDSFTAQYKHIHALTPDQRRSAAEIWTRSARIYLSVVVSGWQPMDLAMQAHVDHILAAF